MPWMSQFSLKESHVPLDGRRRLERSVQKRRDVGDRGGDVKKSDIQSPLPLAIVMGGAAGNVAVQVKVGKSIRSRTVRLSI